jgi:hypothetical protein
MRWTARDVPRRTTATPTSNGLRLLAARFRTAQEIGTFVERSNVGKMIYRNGSQQGDPCQSRRFPCAFGR